MPKTSDAGRAARRWLRPRPPPTGELSASDLLNKSVKNASNESVGDINDLRIDSSGKIAAVIVGVGGFLGLGEKDVALPFEQLRSRAMPMAASSSPPRSPRRACSRLPNGRSQKTARKAARKRTSSVAARRAPGRNFICVGIARCCMEPACATTTFPPFGRTQEWRKELKS